LPVYSFDKEASILIVDGILLGT